MRTLKRLLPWFLIGLCTFALAGSDSDCEIDIDDDGIEIDNDGDDDFDDWWDDLFDKRIVSMAPGADYFCVA